MGHVCPNYSFSFSLWANVPLPSTSPKNKCFGEAPLPCGAGRRFFAPYGREGYIEKIFQPCIQFFYFFQWGAKKYPTLVTRTPGYFFAPFLNSLFYRNIKRVRLFVYKNCIISFSFYFAFLYLIIMLF